MLTVDPSETFASRRITTSGIFSFLAVLAARGIPLVSTVAT